MTTEQVPSKEQVRPLTDRLISACVAGCSCLTKTPVIHYHEPLCHYRLHMEALHALNALTAVYDVFGIGAAVRTPSTLLENVKNAFRRSNCLSAIERQFFTKVVKDDDGEDIEECQLNWGSDPEKYVEQFRAALAAYSGHEPPAECAGCAEFVRLQQQLCGLLGVDEEGDSIALHDRIEKGIQAWQDEAKLNMHKVITCGVIATHPDPNLSRTKAYAGKWNSKQAEDVRKLRDERDRLLAERASQPPGAKFKEGDRVHWFSVVAGKEQHGTVTRVEAIPATAKYDVQFDSGQAGYHIDGIPEARLTLTKESAR